MASTTSTELRRILDSLPAGLPPVRPVVLTAREHTPATITYAVDVPLAGVMLGVRFPRAYPRGCRLLSVWWQGGDDVILGGEPVPLKAARLQKFWSKGGEQLRVTVGLPPGADVERLARDSGTRPYSVLVPPDQSGSVETRQGWAP